MLLSLKSFRSHISAVFHSVFITLFGGAPAPKPAPSAPRAAEARVSRQPTMADVMESDAYMTGVDPLKPGSLIKGTVVRIDENSGEVMVDIGAKSEGIIPKDEVGHEEISVGEIQAMLAAALDAAERFQPAFHFLILGGMSADDASQAALFETCGEA